MIITKAISGYIADIDTSLTEALRKIEENRAGIVFCVSEDGRLHGVLTDGDFRRWVMGGGKSISLATPLRKMMNTEFSSANLGDDQAKIEALLLRRIKHLPLLDQMGRLVAVAHDQRGDLTIGTRRIGPGHPCFVIAEIGNNHNGSLECARKLIDEAVAAGADCAKFQLRDLASLYKNAGDARDAAEDLGTQYTLDLLSRFQLAPDDLFRAFEYCVDRGIQPLCTPWDLPSLERLESWGMPAYKVASADLTNHDLLAALADTGKPLICSTGMSNETEIVAAIKLLRQRGAEFALLHCNSTYPAPFKDINLQYIKKLRDLGDCPVGYSSHDRGINIVAAAVALGASIIEKHFTLDRSMEGNDHRISLLPSEFTEMVTAVRQVEMALGTGSERRLSQGEIMNRETLGKSLVINCDLDAGSVVEARMIEVLSPGRGLPPYRKNDIIGKACRRRLKKGDILFDSDFSVVNAQPRAYSFARPFGIPVRYHDLNSLALMSNFDLLEFHLSYNDLAEDIGAYFSEPYDMDLVVHAPELFEGDHLLDLCSLDDAYRALSIDNLKRVVDVSLALKPFFKRAGRPRIITNVGGFTLDHPLERAKRAERYDMVMESLSRIDLSEVEILPQTMPPFPWHFGGQRYQNLFLDPDEIHQICAAHGLRVCLDTSHSKLACTHFKWSFTDFLKKVGPHTAHLHIADAQGVDGEGLQIGDGDIVLSQMGETLRAYAPGTSFIPEIWQGHKNGGEGFWVALERLEKVL